jgi:branched-subunit amino acid transport protein
MTNTYIWIAILGMSVLVLAMRWSFMVLPRRFQPKGALAQALGFAPLAALVAICAPEVMKFQMDSLGRSDFPEWRTLFADWRLWGGLTMILVTLLLQKWKSAALFGLVAATLVVFQLA